MTHSSPRFSIVIPTRNRVETLAACLKTCLDQTFDDYEIVINDNSDGPETEVYVQQLLASSERAKLLVRYFKNDSAVAISINFERSVAKATGDYLIVLGDDDGMLPRCLQEVQWLIEQTGMKVIKWANALYTWPTVAVAGAANYLGFGLVRSYTIESGIDAILESVRTLEYVNLPMLYINAAVSREVVDQIRKKGGKVFGSRCADVYSGFAVAYFAPRFASSTVPLTIAGLSRSSTGTSHLFAGGNAAPVTDYNSLNAKLGVVRHPKVPDLPIYPSQVVAESFLDAKDQLFSGDDRLVLSRAHIFEEMAKRADLANPAVIDEFRACAADDPQLSALVEDILSRERSPQPKPRIRPELLGADGANLHLDAADFGIVDVGGAVDFIDKVVWPANAPLRYDLGSYEGQIAELSQDLIATRELLIERTNQGQALANDLAQTREILIERTNLSATLSSELIERTSRLEGAVVEHRKLTDEVAELKAQVAMFKSKRWK